MQVNRARPWIVPLVLVAVAAHEAAAQSPESDPAVGIPPVASPPGIVPDIPDSLLARTSISHDRFSFKLGLAFLVDYTAFSQDEASLTQVGSQRDQAELRDFRIMGRGHLDVLADWRYAISLQYKGFAQDPGQRNWQVADLSLSTNLGSFAQVTFGKVKQTYVYEMVGDAANLPQAERLLGPFFKSRDIGIKLGNTAFGKRATWAVGWFNDWLINDEAFDVSGHQVTGRLTALPVWTDDSRRYLHLGISGRYNGADNDELRFSGKPESNVADLFVDTGTLDASHAWQLGLEVLYADGPFSVLAEYAQAWVATAGGASLNGWYVTGSWIVTGGGPRPYDRAVGYARRVPITRRHGELELVGRFGRLDLDDADVSGGTLTKWYLGANWWATTRWKASVGYGNASLDRFDLEGRTGIFLARLQWIF